MRRLTPPQRARCLGIGAGVLLLAVLAAVAYWWLARPTLRDAGVPEPAAVAPAVADAAVAAPASVAPASHVPAPLPSPCPLPPRVPAGAEPLQSPVPAGMPGLTVASANAQPLAGFSIEARVLSRRDYAYGREADYSPTDLALGWGRMREDAVVSRLDIEQRGRWYHYTWGRGSPPIPSREIAKSSANMHLIPGDAAIATALAGVRKDQRVRIDGWLVQLKAADGWSWRSSLTRDDQGGGACEVIYACSITLL